MTDMAANRFYKKIIIFLQKPSNVWWFLGVLTVFKLVYICFIPITPQEAYYWYYSKHPALSYFDHPPMAAYSIWLGTQLFGDIIFGVKFLGVFWGLGTSVLIYLTIREGIKKFELDAVGITDQLPLMGVLLFNLTIFSHLYSITIMPDTPLVFFWALALFAIMKVKIQDDGRWFLLAGVAVGLGFLSKYTILAIIPGILLAMIIDPDLRKYFFSPYPYIALVIAIILSMPVMIWNAQHDWASFAFQFSRRAGKVARLRSKYIIQLFFSQLFLLTPFIMVMFFLLIRKIFVRGINGQIARIGFWTGLPLIVVFVGYSLFSLVKMNWLLPAYIGWIVAVVFSYHSLYYIRVGWLKSGLYSSFWLVLIGYALFLVPNIPLGNGNTWSGWKEVAAEVKNLQDQLGGRSKVFLFSNSYKGASLLKFYLQDKGQEVYAQNVYGQPALQFDYWPLPDSLKGKDAIYVFDDRREYKDDLEKVTTYFERFNAVKEITIHFIPGIATRTFYIYHAQGYHGPKQ